MSAKRTVGRSELSFEVGDGLLDIDEILNRDSWYQIDDFVQRNFLQEILNEFNDLHTLDPERAPQEQKKKQRAVRSKRTPQKTVETFVETKACNAKADGGEKLKDKIEKPSTSKKKNDEKSGDSGKIEKKKQAASVCKKGAGKSAKDRKSQGNSPAASTSSTVAMSDDVTKPMSGDVTKPMSDDVTKAMSDDVTKAMSDDVTKAMSDDVTKPMSDDVTKAMSDDVTKPMSDDVTKAMSDDVTKAMSDDVTTAMSDDVTTAYDASTLVTPSALSDITETTEGTSVMASQDALGYSFETSVPQGESSRIDMEKTLIERRNEPKSNEDQSATIVDAEKTILINVGDKRKERKSLGRSRGEYSGGEVRVEVTPDKEISEEHELEDTKRRRRQPTRKQKGVKHDVVGEIAEEDIASGSGQKRSGRKSSGRSKTSKEKETVGTVADETISTSHEESKLEKRRGRKSLRVSKWLEDQSKLEKQMSGDEELGGQSRAKRRSLDTSKSPQENVGKVAEKNISHEEPGGKKKRGRKSLRRSKCSEERNVSPAEKQTSDAGEFSGQTRAKRRSLDSSKSSKRNTEKTAEEKLSTSRGATAVEEETGSWSLGVSQCSEEVAEGTTRRRSPRTSKSPKGDAEKISKQNISNEEPEGEKTPKKSLSKSSKKVCPVGKRLLQDCEQSVAEEIPKRRSLRVLRSSREDAEKSVEKNTSTSQEEAGKSSETSELRKKKKIGRKSEKKSTSTRRKSQEYDVEKQKEKSKCVEQAKKPADAEKDVGWRSLGIPKSWIDKKNVEKSAEANISTAHKESDGEKQKEKSKCAEQEKNPADVDKERALKSLGTSKSWEEKKNDEQPGKKNTSIDRKESDGEKQKGVPKDNEDSDAKKKGEVRCSREEKCSPKKEEDRKTERKKKSKRNKSATKEKKVSSYKKMLLEKKKKREEKRLKRHERKANRAMAEFDHQVSSIAKKMGFLQESQSDSSDSSDFSDSSSPSDSDETEDSTISSGSSVFSSTYSSCTSGTDDCSCSHRSSCSGCGKECTDPNCRCATPCSCIDFTDSSDEYSIISD